MRVWLLWISVVATAGAESPSSLERQRASIAQQRVSVARQVQGAVNGGSSFFTTAWTTPAATSMASVMADCDPLTKTSVDPLVEDAAKREGIKPELLRAVISQESAFRPCAVSVKGAMGLMQLMPATAEMFAVKDPFDPKENIDSGAKFLKQLLTRYNGDVSLALGAYNAGTGRVDATGAVPAIPETVQYIRKILGNLAIH